jgi:hypothetical protein
MASRNKEAISLHELASNVAAIVFGNCVSSGGREAYQILDTWNARMRRKERRRWWQPVTGFDPASAFQGNEQAAGRGWMKAAGGALQPVWRKVGFCFFDMCTTTGKGELIDECVCHETHDSSHDSRRVTSQSQETTHTRPQGAVVRCLQLTLR